MKKNFGKWKQWTEERLGAAKGTQTTEDFRRLEQETDNKHKTLDKVWQAATIYQAQVAKKKESLEDPKIKLTPIETLGSALISYGVAFEDDSLYGQSLVKLGKTHEKIGVMQQDFGTKLKEGYLASLDRSIAEVKDYQLLKKKLESRRLDYDAKLGKVQKAKKERPDLEQDMQAAKTKYEDTETDLRNRMIAFVESEEDAYRDITDFLEAELGFYRSVTELLESVQASWAPIDKTPSSRPVRSTPARSPSNVGHSPRPSRNGSTHGDDDDSYFGYQEEASSGIAARSPGQSNLGVPSSGQRRLSPSSRTGSTDNMGALPKRSPSFSSIASSATEDSASGRRPAPAPKKKPSLSSAKKQVRAVYDFDGESNEELSFRTGDIINVTEEVNEGWWFGEIAAGSGSRQSGIFPVNYTEEIQAPAPPPMPNRPRAASRSYSSQAAPTYADEPEDDDYAQAGEAYADEASPFGDTPKNGSYRTAPAPPAARRPTAPASPSISRSSSNYTPQAARTRSPAPPPPAMARANAQPTRASAARPAAPSRSASGYGGSPAASPMGTPAEVACGECGCEDYTENVFKKGVCNNCFHKH